MNTSQYNVMQITLNPFILWEIAQNIDVIEHSLCDFKKIA